MCDRDMSENFNHDPKIKFLKKKLLKSSPKASDRPHPHAHVHVHDHVHIHDHVHDNACSR